MPVVLYEIAYSGPCQAVRLTAQHLGIKLDIKTVQLTQSEQKKPEFKAISPVQTVPAIDDDGFMVFDSHVIMTYLVNKYAPDSPLYPKDPQQRANVDMMLYFDIGTLYNSIYAGYLRPQIYEKRPPDPEKAEVVKKNLELLENTMLKTTYMAGDHITVADYALICSLYFAEEIGGFSMEFYPKISTWMQRMRKETPNFEEIVVIPVEGLKKYVQEIQKQH